MPLDGTRKVLSLAMVDPDLQTRKIFADWVRRTAGVRCAGVYDCGGRTLEDLQLQKPAVVIIESNKLGGTFLSRLKMGLPGTCCYIYTETLNPDEVFQSLATGAAGYFLKRVPLVKILAAIRRNFSGIAASREIAATRVLEFFDGWVGDAEPAIFPQRQQEVLDLLVQGFNTQEIAQTLRVSVRTVDTHIRRIFQKLGVHSRAQAVVCFTQIRQASLKPGQMPLNSARQPVRLSFPPNATQSGVDRIRVNP